MTERLSVTVGTEPIEFEVGRIAKQAHGSVLVRQGDTMVLSAVVTSPDLRPGQDFFPLTVDYREKSASAGRIPGNFFRREGRPTEREVLVCRVTDRPLRPLFPKGFINEVQVFSTVYSADNIHDPDVLSINGASAALHISKIPFDGPIGAVRIGRLDGKLLVNPSMDEMIDSSLDIIVAGTKDAIMMVEGGAAEEPEDVVIEALELAHEEIKKVCQGIEELRQKVGVEKMAFVPAAADESIGSQVESFASARIQDALAIAEKHPRQEALDAVYDDLDAHFSEKLDDDEYSAQKGEMKRAFGSIEKRLMRETVLTERRRVDGRGLDVIRNITIEVGVLPRVHGSCLFTRGETQALVTTTLGTSRDEQKLDELTGEEFKRFILHYNFPSWSVGEVRPVRGPGRREIGHGALAERALEPVVPFKSDEVTDPDAHPDFPYTIRIVSDITESNGSSSMASVCGGTLSMMDAGVPIHAPVAGIAMGLIKDGDRYAILSDILGAEDHLGDMDFKICGTSEGITAFQMDIKIQGITTQIMREALEQARLGRLFILDKMKEALAAPRTEISDYAPRIHTIKIDVDKIREIIGPG
ncbi:MAG: polyribonucleotide nucleotidyltransferase, partial [Candidatus Hydrogenedentes bacterium]|nr:polyribonucleotide nucleotidyltransferase [Candidatus Hydrogenedentota bacterium]